MSEPRESDEFNDGQEDPSLRELLSFMQAMWRQIWDQASSAARMAILSYFAAATILVLVDSAFTGWVLFGDGLSGVDPSLYAQIIPALFIAQIVETVWLIRSSDFDEDDERPPPAPGEVRIDERFTAALFAFSVGLLAVAGELLAILAISASSSDFTHQISDVLLPLTIEVQMMYLLISLFVRGMSVFFESNMGAPEELALNPSSYPADSSG